MWLIQKLLSMKLSFKKPYLKESELDLNVRIDFIYDKFKRPIHDSVCEPINNSIFRSVDKKTYMIPYRLMWDSNQMLHILLKLANHTIV